MSATEVIVVSARSETSMDASAGVWLVHLEVPEFQANMSLSAMEEIATRYATDPDVEAAIMEALEECAGDLMEAFGEMSDAFADLEVE